MFRAFFIGFVDRDDTKSYPKLAVLAKKMDRNDFMISNSPYSLLYERPISRGPVVVHSDSPPSPPMTMDSPLESNVVLNRQREAVGPHVSTDLGIEGIDQFGTNTFRVHTWISSPSVPTELHTQSPDEDVETDTEFARHRVEASQHADKDVETDAVFDKQWVETAEHAEEDVETDTQFDKHWLEQSQHAKEDEETDTEFERQQAK